MNCSLIRQTAPVAALMLAVGITTAHGEPAATSRAADPKTAQAQAAEPKEAVCAVCGVREKAGPEPVAATYVYQGKIYYFCKQACKEEFRLDPEKWIKAAAAAPAPAEPKQAAKPGAAAVPT